MTRIVTAIKRYGPKAGHLWLNWSAIKLSFAIGCIVGLIVGAFGAVAGDASVSLIHAVAGRSL